MSLITRCPACETLFKVVPDQLRMSDGWVRCGQCDEIFDASLHLLQVSPEEGAAAVQDEGAAVAVEHDGTDSLDAAPQPFDVVLDSDPLISPGEFPVEQEQVYPNPQDADSALSLPESIPDACLRVDDVISISTDVLHGQAEVSSPDPGTDAQPAQVVDADQDERESGQRTELSEVSFLGDKKRGSFWYKPLMRATLVMLGLVLLLGLAGQIVVHERDRIAASEPELKPWLLAMCDLLNCTLSPWRRIESIVIDSSSFTKIRGDAYRLNFTLNNTAATALAVPAIELTLTDSLDQPLVRRIFLPVELGVRSDTLVAGSELPASLAVAVKAGGSADRVAGYRLLAFYP